MRCAAGGGHALGLEIFLHIGLLQNFVDGTVQCIDYRLRCAAWRHRTEPQFNRIAGDGVAHGGHVGQCVPALFGGDRERAQLARADMRHYRQQTADNDGGLPGEQIGHGRAGAFIVYADHRRAGHAEHQFSCHVRQAAHTAGGIGEIAGLGFGERDQFFGGFRRQGRVHRQHKRRNAELGDAGQ